MGTQLLCKHKDFEAHYGKRRMNFSINTTGHPFTHDKKNKKNEVVSDFTGNSNNY
jgi:hypothetical protein